MSLIYKSILSPSPLSDPLADLVVVASFKPTRQSRCCHLLQTHPMIWLPLPLSFSQSISLPLSHDRGLVLRKIEFFVMFCFLLIWFIYGIFYYNICLKAEKMWENVFSRGFSRTQPSPLKYFPKHFLGCNQTPENIFTWKYIILWKHFTLSCTQP